MKRYILIFGWLAIKGEQKIKTASGDKNAGRGDKMAEAQKRSERHRDGFAGPGGYSENMEAWRSFLRGSWRLCTPPLDLFVKNVLFLQPKILFL